MLEPGKGELEEQELEEEELGSHCRTVKPSGSAKTNVDLVSGERKLVQGLASHNEGPCFCIFEEGNASALWRLRPVRAATPLTPRATYMGTYMGRTVGRTAALGQDLLSKLTLCRLDEKR